MFRKTLYLFFSLLPYCLSGQNLSALIPLLPDGITRINTQPANIISDNLEFDYYLFGVESNLAGNILQYQLPFSVEVKKGSLSLFRNEIEQTTIRFPAVSVPISKTTFVGGYINIRQHINAHGLTHDFGNDISAEFSDKELFFQPRVNQSAHLTMMNYYQGGVAYARILKQNRQYRIQGGISIEGLLGTSSAYADINHIDYTNTASNVLSISDYHLVVGNSKHMRNPSDNKWLWLPDRSLGTSSNFGLSWNKKMTYKDNTSVWQLTQVGISVLNLGFIKYSHGNDSFTGIKSNTQIILDIDRTFGETFSSTAIFDSLSRVLEVSKSVGTYKVGLPTTFNVEAFAQKLNWTVYSSIQLNLAQMIGLEHYVSTASNIKLIPAWRGEHIALGAPITLTTTSGVQVGISVDAGPLAFGMDLGTINPTGSRQIGFFILLKKNLQSQRKALLPCPIVPPRY